jgi:hypothetical protein
MAGSSRPGGRAGNHISMSTTSNNDFQPPVGGLPVVQSGRGTYRSNPRNESDAMVCMEHTCAKKFYHSYDLLNHLKAVHKNFLPSNYPQLELRVCTFCNAVFQKTGLKVHVAKSHRDLINTDNSTDSFVEPSFDDTGVHDGTSVDLLQSLNDGDVTDSSDVINNNNIPEDAPIHHAEVHESSPLEGSPANISDQPFRFAPVRYMPDTCIKTFQDILIRILTTIINNSCTSNIYTRAVQAFINAPVLILISRAKRGGKDGKFLIRSFRHALAGDDLIDYINQQSIIFAKGLANGSNIRIDDNNVSAQSVPPRVIKRMRNLLSNGRAGKALRSLEAHVEQTPLPEPDVVKARMLELHPKATVTDFLPVPSDDWESLMLGEDQVSCGIEELPKESGTAFSAWTYELVQLAIKGSPPMLTLITKLFNLMLSGKAGDPNLWGTSRLIPIGKKGGGVRPIAIGEIWLRVINRIIAKQLSKEAAIYLAPYQLGVGVPGGVETIIHTASIAHQHRNLSIMAIDFTNAFNTIRRRFIYDGLCDAFPSLRRYFVWSYGKASVLCDNNGIPVCTSETGVRQGDPLGPMFFSLGLHQVLKSCASKHGGVQLLAYLDDISLIGDPVQCMEAFDEVKSQGHMVGLEVNTRKSFLLCKSSLVDGIPSHYRSGDLYPKVKMDVGDVLGVPIGDSDKVVEGLFARFTQRAAILKVLSAIPITMAVPLIQCCVNERPVFWMRCVPFDNAGSAGFYFDRQVDICLAKLCNRDDLSDLSGYVRHLPATLGGIGIRRMDSCLDLYIASLLFAVKQMQKTYPREADMLFTFESYDDMPIAIHSMFLSIKRANPNLFRSFLTSDPDRVDPYTGEIEVETKEDGACESKVDVAPEVEVVRFKDIRSLEIPKPSQYFVSMDAIIYEKVLTRCPFPSVKKWFQSGCSVGTTRWIWLGCNKFEVLRIDEEAYRDALMLRLLIPFYYKNQATIRQCACGAYQTEDEFGYHSLSCPTMRSSKWRHDLIKEAVKAFLLRCRVQEVTLEAPLTATSPLRIDLKYIDRGVTKYIDVSVINPTSRSYDRNMQIEMEPGNPSLIQEKEKMKKYVKRELGVTDSNFIPFVIEATGRFGPKAVHLIDDICRITTEADKRLQAARNFFLQRLQVLLILGNSRHIQEYRKTSTSSQRVDPSRHQPVIASTPDVDAGPPSPMAEDDVNNNNNSNVNASSVSHAPTVIVIDRVDGDPGDNNVSPSNQVSNQAIPEVVVVIPSPTPIEEAGDIVTTQPDNGMLSESDNISIATEVDTSDVVDHMAQSVAQSNDATFILTPNCGSQQDDDT